MKAYLVSLFIFLGFQGKAQEDILFSIYFAHDQYTLEESHLVLIDSLNKVEDKAQYDIHIKGFTNSIGPGQYNLELSRKRAEEVKKYLRSFTIISSIGHGELGTEDANNRRVEVLFHHKSRHIPLPGERFERPIMMDSLANMIPHFDMPVVGEKIALNGILFYPDQDVIMDESVPALEGLIGVLNYHRNIKFKLIGHICCGDPEQPGMDVVNTRTGEKNLSEARARSVYLYLLKKGIDRRRMRYLGMAYRHPTVKGDEFDRRVEIEITSIDWSAITPKEGGE